ESAAEGAPGSLPAGRVGRPHGLDGSFYVTRPRPRLLLGVGAVVTVAGRTAPIVRRAGTEQRPIVRLEGIDARSAAEALRGSELFVDGGDAPTLGEGEWWAHELEGCEVLDGEQLLGSVKRLIELPSCEALEVLAADGGEVIIVPLVKDAVRVVAPARKRIEVDLDFLGLGGRARVAGESGAAEEPAADA
ncbi:MAG TPA: ribosome maturation factor RimM, partial [Solirubrobacteraceae bacterium]|nr:ribosome maturation factor RimM [Solirubrobacteraceae bacterium]